MIQEPTEDFFKLKDLILEVTDNLNNLEKNLGDTYVQKEMSKRLLTTIDDVKNIRGQFLG